MIKRILKFLEPSLKKLYKKISQPTAPNLSGDRDIEYSWITANLPEGSGSALDFGGGSGYMGLIAARKGYNVTSIDLQNVSWPYYHPQLTFFQEDLFKMNFPSGHFNLIINCSVIEHVGLAGRYNIKKFNKDGDLSAMALLSNIMKPEGIMLLTIPVGRDSVFPPLHRVYGNIRLPRLIESWKTEKSEFWIKNKNNRWICVDKETALELNPSEHYYGLGLFMLKKIMS